jgi:hypothetical protein
MLTKDQVQVGDILEVVDDPLEPPKLHKHGKFQLTIKAIYDDYLMADFGPIPMEYLSKLQKVKPHDGA